MLPPPVNAVPGIVLAVGLSSPWVMVFELKFPAQYMLSWKAQTRSKMVVRVQFHTVPNFARWPRPCRLLLSLALRRCWCQKTNLAPL